MGGKLGPADQSNSTWELGMGMGRERWTVSELCVCVCVE